METEVDIIGNLAALSPIIGLLLLIIIYLVRENYLLKKEVKELHAASKEEALKIITMGNDINNSLQLLIAKLPTK